MRGNVPLTPLNYRNAVIIIVLLHCQGSCTFTFAFAVILCVLIWNELFKYVYIITGTLNISQTFAKHFPEGAPSKD